MACAMPIPPAITAIVARPAWPYRDYVLRAFRDNKPFDVFTREQLAGDLMPNATVEQKDSVCLQPHGPHLGGRRLATERISGQVWRRAGARLEHQLAWAPPWDAPNATTTNSIPILTKDFYAMKAFFADVKETGLVLGFRNRCVCAENAGL